MARAVLITRPNHDVILNFLYYWSEEVVKLAKKKCFTLLDLKGDKSCKDKFESYIKKNDPVLLFFNGHGSEREISGHDDEVIVELGDNDKFLSGRIVYARTCDSAVELGKKCKSKAFIGYSWRFIFYFNSKNVSNPTRDKLAARFLQPSNLVATTLLKGHTTEDAYNRSQEAMIKNLFKMLSSEASHEEKAVASFLWGNIQSQRLYGDPKASV